MQTLTVGHQKETIHRMEKDIELFKTRFSKVTDDLLGERRCQKVTMVLILERAYQQKMIPGLTNQLVMPDTSFRKQISLTFRSRLPSTHIHLQKKRYYFCC